MNSAPANLVRTVFLLGALMALFVAVGWLIGGQEGMIVAFAIAAATNLMAVFNSKSAALRASRAMPVTQAQAPWLHEMVEDLARSANIPKPEVYIIDTDMPNAFATGRNPNNAAVAVTTGIMDILDRDELAGVIAHEIAHVDNYDILTSGIAGTLAGAITYLANMARYTALSNTRSRSRNSGGAIGALLAIILAPIAATVIQLAVTRSREFGADRNGAQLLGDPIPLANALLKLEQAGTHHSHAAHAFMAHMYIVPINLGSMRDLFRTHPPTEERVRRLHAMKGELSVEPIR